VTRRLVNITLDNLDDMPRRCRKCVFWELDPVAGARATETGDTELEKEAGYVLFAPASYVPRSVAFPTSPVSADAALLMTAEVLPEFGGGGIARMLVQGVAKDLTRRGIKAVEAFGDAKWQGLGHCVLPADYLLAVGFKTVRPHPRFPRLRLELKTVASWREDVEVALERLLGSMSPEGALRPV
jgi:GNAT superfamily N-acetyltransferase